jgi:hypothetical protein
MDKTAYYLGVKMAMVDAGVASPEDAGMPDLSEAENPAEALAVMLQSEPDISENPENEPDEPIGAPKDDGRTYSAHRSGNITNDLENSMGLNIRGPEVTSV